LKTPITYSYFEYNQKTGKRTKVTKTAATEFSAADINMAARVIYAESIGSSGGVEQSNADRRAVASVILNRVGATGLRGGRQMTLTGVVEAEGAFEAVFAQKSKFVNSEPSSAADKLSSEEIKDLNASITIMVDTIENGPAYSFDSFRAAKGSPGRIKIGGNEFWDDDKIYRNTDTKK
jgi:hypothetical protein